MKNIDNRKYIIALIFALIPLIFIVRLFYMQVVDEKWKLRAAQISENKVIPILQEELFMIETIPSLSQMKFTMTLG